MLTIEKNGDRFSEQKLLEGQQLLVTCVQHIAQELGPGMKEKHGLQITKDLLAKYGFGKNWHPPKVRFGANTLMTFSDASDPNVVLGENDIFFLDLGPIIEEHECDYGQTFVLGNDIDHLRLRDSSEQLFQKVKAEWSKNKLSGTALYEFADSSAKEMGYEFVVKGASGHRIGDFPHHLHYRGNMKDIKTSLNANRWILEIQIHDKKLNRGAFFEDIL